MQEVLMDPNATGPQIFYYMVRGGKEQKNVTILEPGTVGGEFIKTYGHYHIGNLDETYYFVQGEGIALLQKLATNQDGSLNPRIVEEFKVVIVSAGQNLFIPSGYGHLILNTGTEYFVTIDDSPVDFTESDPTSLPGHADYQLVKQMRGFAYYVVEQNGKAVLKRNPNYEKIENEELSGLTIL
jgi:glucose-6-phosphate isomerase